MDAESQGNSNPLIEFHAIGHPRFPAPYPAGRNIPDWYKNLQIEVKSTRSDEVIPTIKRCPPFLEAITCGYIIPLADDVRFSTDERGNLSFQSANDVVHTHDTVQYQGTPFTSRIIVKFMSPWTIRTTAGYSTLLLPALNRFHIPFLMLSGVVETDSWYREVHFPAICQLPPKSNYLMERGTPLMQAIPFRREHWQSMVGECDQQLSGAIGASATANLHVYKDEHWQKKTFK